MQDPITYQQCLSIIEKFYSKKDGYCSYQAGQLEQFTQQKVCLTYGEILPESLDRLLAQLKINHGEVFYDLGSGVGKIPLQVFLTTKINQVYGIEAFPPRHEVATNIYAAVKSQYQEYFIADTELQSIIGNFLDYDLSDATIIFMDSLCFSDELMGLLNKKLNALSKLKYIIGLRLMDLPNFILQPTIQLDFSWSHNSGGSCVYIYANKNCLFDP